MNMSEMNSLTDVIKENTPLFTPIGVFAAIGGYFLSKIDIENLDSNILMNLLLMVTSFSLFIVALIVSIELIKKLNSVKNLNKSSYIFYSSVKCAMISLNLLLIYMILRILYYSIF